VSSEQSLGLTTGERVWCRVGIGRSLKWKYPYLCAESTPVPLTISLTEPSQLQGVHIIEIYDDNDDDDDDDDDNIKGDDPISVTQYINWAISHLQRLGVWQQHRLSRNNWYFCPVYTSTVQSWPAVTIQSDLVHTIHLFLVSAAVATTEQVTKHNLQTQQVRMENKNTTKT